MIRRCVGDKNCVSCDVVYTSLFSNTMVQRAATELTVAHLFSMTVGRSSTKTYTTVLHYGYIATCVCSWILLDWRIEWGVVLGAEDDLLPDEVDYFNDAVVAVRENWEGGLRAIWDPIFWNIFFKLQTVPWTLVNKYNIRRLILKIFKYLYLV